MGGWEPSNLHAKANAFFKEAKYPCWFCGECECCEGILNSGVCVCRVGGIDPGVGVCQKCGRVAKCCTETLFVGRGRVPARSAGLGDCKCVSIIFCRCVKVRSGEHTEVRGSVKGGLRADMLEEIREEGSEVSCCRLLGWRGWGWGPGAQGHYVRERGGVHEDRRVRGYMRSGLEPEGLLFIVRADDGIGCFI